jgi:hypothetical protein
MPDESLAAVDGETLFRELFRLQDEIESTTARLSDLHDELGAVTNEIGERFAPDLIAPAHDAYMAVA